MNQLVRDAHKRRLRYLQIQAALKGISTPPEILIEIADIKTLIKNGSNIEHRYCNRIDLMLEHCFNSWRYKGSFH